MIDGKSMKNKKYAEDWWGVKNEIWKRIDWKLEKSKWNYGEYQMSDYDMHSCKKCYRTAFTELDSEIPFCMNCEIKMEKVIKW